MAIRFHLDENVHHAIAKGLRQRGIDVTTTSDANLIGATDEQQLEFALSENRVLVTHDEDHLRLHQQGIPHAGIAYSNARSSSIGRMVHGLVRLWRNKTSEAIQGCVEFL